jgi:hypothetical protein
VSVKVRLAGSSKHALMRVIRRAVQAVGPITLFDKSFLQSLNINESVWFDRRTQEQEVGIIAEKFPERNNGFRRQPSGGRLFSGGEALRSALPSLAAPEGWRCR